MADKPYCTTRELVEGVLKPHASDPAMSHCALVPPGHQQQDAEYYVCHAWDRPFRDLVECLRMHFPGVKKGVTVWIDLFCLDQGSSELAKGQEPSLQLLSAVQSMSKSTLLILDPEGLCFKRLWCLHEQNTAAAASSGFLSSLEVLPHLLGKADFANVAEALCSLDASAAQTSLAEDKAAILKRISTVTGGISKFNASLKQALVGLLAQLLERSTLQQRPGLLGLAKEILHIDHALGAPLVEPVMQCVVEARSRVSDVWQDNGATLANMALLMRAKGNLKSSEQMFRVALEKAKAYFGVSHHHTVTVRMQLACLLKSKGDLSESVTLYQDALESRRKELGDRDPGVATVLNNLGDLRGMQGHLKQADGLLRDALSIRLDVYGGWHRITAMSMHSLAVLLMKKGTNEDLSNARGLLQRVLEVRERMHGSDHEDIVACSKSLQELTALEMKAQAKERVLIKLQHKVRPLGSARRFHLRSPASALPSLSTKTDL